jgi:hypothetical protein
MLRVLIVLWSLTITTLTVAQPSTFRAGAATSNITPPLGVSLNGGMSDREARHIHDELRARCLVLDDGKTRIAIVTCDSCMISRESFDEAKRLVEEETRLPSAHLLMSATHTHSAVSSCGVFQSDVEKDYLPFLARRIADGVRRAANNLAPARIGWGSGSVPEEVFNRRWHMKPGTVPPGPFDRETDVVKMNPPRASPNLIRPAGPIDPTVSVISIQRPDGKPLALLANYSLHYVGGTGPGHVSADYFGAFCERIEELLVDQRRDPPFVAMLTNGTSGDINNINFRQKGQRREPYEQIRRVADRVAREVEKVVASIEHRADAKLDGRETKLKLGVRRPNADEVAKARAVVAKAKSDGRTLRGLSEIYARETVLLADYPEEVELELQVLRIGDVAICAIPCEVFVEIGLELRQKSRLAMTFTIELANGYNGYLPTPAHHELGGYETWRARSSYLEVQASVKIVRELEKLLRAIEGE